MCGMMNLPPSIHDTREGSEHPHRQVGTAGLDKKKQDPTISCLQKYIYIYTLNVKTQIS